MCKYASTVPAPEQDVKLYHMYDWEESTEGGRSYNTEVFGHECAKVA